MKERLDKLISSQSMATRSEISKLIRSGSVKINGSVMRDPSFKADPSADFIEINSEPFLYRKNIYIMMNKPAGVVSASRDPRKKTVTDLVPENIQRPNLFPAGRLDKDTTGFVLITDDGAFAHDILSPKRHVDKTYIAETDSEIAEKYIAEIKSGMTLGDEKLLPATIGLTGKNGQAFVYKIVLHEGRYHQIKRMLAASDTHLLSLKRIKMGKLDLDESLKPGECRELTSDEIALIKRPE